MVEYIDINPKSRLVIDVDPVPLDPRSDECVTGCWTPPSYWGRLADGPQERFPFPGDLAEAHRRLWDSSSWDPERKIKRWAWVNFGTLIEHHGNTYWWCDRGMFDVMIGGEFTREMQHDIIEADRHAYRRWENGDARIITLQRKATFKRMGKRSPNPADDLLEVWENVESQADLYLEDYSPAQAALDFFTLDRKELAVIHAMIDEARS